MTATKRTAAGAAAAILLAAAAGALVIGRQHGDGAPATAAADASRTASAAQAGATQAGNTGQDARKTGDKPLWRSLTPAQQRALQPLQGEWDGLDGLRKRKWLQLANRFAALPPAEQQRVHERMRAWVALSPAQRELARETYTRTRKIAPDKKTATWESYQQLPDAQKKKLAASATRKTPAAVPGQAGGKTASAPGQGAACPAGMVKNSLSAAPACVPAPAPAVPAQPVAPPQPAAPAPQEKQVPANWGITPNDA